MHANLSAQHEDLRYAPPATREPSWGVMVTNEPPRPARCGRYGGLAHRLAVAPEDSAPLNRVADFALRLRIEPSRPSFAVGLTSMGRCQGQAATAIAWATLWARWGYATLLIDVAGRQSELGRSLRHTVPHVGDVATAIECDRPLPIPQPMTAEMLNLDVLSGLGRTSLTRMADSGLLARLGDCLRERYQRVVWSLPPATSVGLPLMLRGVVDRLVLTIARGRARRDAVEALARRVVDAGHPPLGMVWHR